MCENAQRNNYNLFYQQKEKGVWEILLQYVQFISSHQRIFLGIPWKVKFQYHHDKHKIVIQDETIDGQICLSFGKGLVHILRKQIGWMGGVGKMPTFAYMVGGWGKANA